MLRELARACEDASWDDSIRVVVLTGAGRAFCVGADLKSWSRELPGQAERVLEVVRRVQGRARPAARDRQADARAHQRRLRRRRQRAADGLRPRGDGRTTRSSATSARSTARCPAGGATQWLTIFVGERRAREIVLMCERDPGADRRKEWGLVNWAVPAAELDAKVDACRREPRAQAPADDALREGAPELLERPRVAPDNQPRARLARPLDGDRGAAGRDQDASWTRAMAERRPRPSASGPIALVTTEPP